MGRRLLCVGSVVVVLLAACSSEMSKEDAKASYFVIASTANPQIDQAKAQLGVDESGNLTDPSKLGPFCQTMSTIFQNFINDMNGVEWPESVKEQATEVVSTSAEATQFLSTCAASGGATPPEAVGQLMGALERNQAAVSAFRGVLGIPVAR